MTSILPIGIDELLSGAVENSRLELKATWQDAITGHQILKTLCAYANDLQNLNGGYVVIGVREQDGAAIRPVQGLADGLVDLAQRWIYGNCNRIEPVYMPVIDTPEVDGKRILVLWAPASDSRPHQAPDGPNGERKYWVRIGSNTVAAKDDVLTRLMQQTARVPFDDRRAFDAQIEDLRISLVREFLQDVRSELVNEPNADRIYTAMHLLRKQNGHHVPRNIALLFFTDDPMRWFRGARIDVAQFSDEAGGNAIEEQRFSGPVHHQVRRCLSLLESLAAHHLEKQPSTPETRGWVSYPSLALREAVVNAVYHRSYEGVVEPTKVYLYPDRIEVISYPGPVEGIELDHLRPGASAPPVPARNRRIGELLKELRLAEGRGTGLPKMIRSMRENGSPDPRFDFDAARSYFRVTLPAHPEYVALSALRDVAYFKTVGDDAAALRRLETAYESQPASTVLAMRLMEELAARGKLERAKAIFDGFCRRDTPGFVQMTLALSASLFDANRYEDALNVLECLPDIVSPTEAIEAAISHRRARQEQRAHAFFAKAGNAVLEDPRAAHEFAQTKMALASQLHREGLRDIESRPAYNQLLREAEELLERVTRMDAPAIRRAWAWYNLGQVLQWSGKPLADISAAYQRAVDLNPNEDRFLSALQRIRQ